MLNQITLDITIAKDKFNYEIKDSILLPKTEFSMKADLPKKEPAILDSWQKNNLYKSLEKIPKTRKNLSCMMVLLTQTVICIWVMH